MSKSPAVPTAKRLPSRDATRSHPPSQRNSAAGHRYRYTFRNPTLVDRELPVAITSPRSVLLDDPSFGAAGAGAWASAVDTRPIHTTNNSGRTRTQSMRIRIILREAAALYGARIGRPERPALHGARVGRPEGLPCIPRHQRLSV